MSPNAVDIARHFIARWEGMGLHPYLDSAGYPTIGVGHLIQQHEDFEDGITEAEALALLESDMSEAIQCVDMHVDVELTDSAQASLVSFAFNLGCKAFVGSTLLRLLNAGRPEDAAKQFQKWCKAGGKTIPGLLRRRLEERDLFLDGYQREDYES